MKIIRLHSIHPISPPSQPQLKTFKEANYKKCNTILNFNNILLKSLLNYSNNSPRQNLTSNLFSTFLKCGKVIRTSHEGHCWSEVSVKSHTHLSSFDLSRESHIIKKTVLRNYSTECSRLIQGNLKKGCKLVL